VFAVHRTYELNEREPALKVFWSRCGGMGAEERQAKKDKEAFNKRKEDKDQEPEKLPWAWR